MCIKGPDIGDKAKTISDFLSKVACARHRWSLSNDKELWFRGENVEYDSNLSPDLYRPKSVRSVGAIDNLLNIEYDLHNDFMRCAPQLINDRVDHDYWGWDSYFLLQHHGGVTRLLDWSDGALIALHFAIRSNGNGDAFVYILNWSILKERLRLIYNDMPQQWRIYVKKEKFRESCDLDESQFEDAYLPRDKWDRAEFPMPEAPLILDFPHITRRVAAQRSRVIVFGRDPDFLAREFDRSDSSIKRICIDAACRGQIRHELRDAGVTESLIFPDLDGLGREIKQRWRDRAPS
jgi:hypothetical protein